MLTIDFNLRPGLLSLKTSTTNCRRSADDQRLISRDGDVTVDDAR